MSKLSNEPMQRNHKISLEKFGNNLKWPSRLGGGSRINHFGMGSGVAMKVNENDLTGIRELEFLAHNLELQK